MVMEDKLEKALMQDLVVQEVLEVILVVTQALAQLLTEMEIEQLQVMVV